MMNPTFPVQPSAAPAIGQQICVDAFARSLCFGDKQIAPRLGRIASRDQNLKVFGDVHIVTIANIGHPNPLATHHVGLIVWLSEPSEADIIPGLHAVRFE
jgi:hypothetical protein